MLTQKRNASFRNRIIEVLRLLKNGTVVVEGVNDVSVLNSLGIGSLTYSRVMNKGLSIGAEPVFILMDNDRRGREKARFLEGFLQEKGYNIDNKLGVNMLKMLNSICIEEIYKPVMQLLEIENKNSGRYGQNIFRNSKIYGGSEVYDRRDGRQT